MRRIHGVLHRALTQALQWGWIWINPASSASPPRVRAEIRPPTPEQVVALLGAVEDRPLLFCFLGLAATTGARRGQLLALRWRDVDLHDDGVVAFTRALVIGTDGPVLAATKTDRTHQVELDRVSLRVLCDTHAQAVCRAATAGVALSPEAFVFTHDDDGHRPCPRTKPPRSSSPHVDAGLPHFRLHDLRHFMATQMLSATVPLATVAQRLNHARISTTATSTPMPSARGTDPPPRCSPGCSPIPPWTIGDM